jgi:hypothetical protein
MDRVSGADPDGRSASLGKPVATQRLRRSAAQCELPIPEFTLPYVPHGLDRYRALGYGATSSGL